MRSMGPLLNAQSCLVKQTEDTLGPLLPCLWHNSTRPSIHIKQCCSKVWICNAQPNLAMLKVSVARREQPTFTYSVLCIIQHNCS